MTIRVRGRGTLTLPASLREKYRLGEGGDRRAGLGDFERRPDADEVVLHVDDNQGGVGEAVERHPEPPSCVVVSHRC
jgi:hypothetical protein